MKYVRKSYIIEAVEYTGKNIKEVKDFLNISDDIIERLDIKDIDAVVKVLGKNINAGDYIIKSGNDEFKIYSSNDFNKKFNIYCESYMDKWAKNEVELRIAQAKNMMTNPNKEDIDFTRSVYTAGLNAYLAIIDRNFSNNFADMAERIFNRLNKNKPLTPITGNDAEWNLLYFDKELNIERYQCNRMASLFKVIDKNDNSIRYNDVSRCVEFIGDEFDNERSYSQDIYAFINNKFPISMPYYPSIEPYKVYIDKDTKKRYMIITPDGKRIML